jgi:hypothetical protein
MTDRVRPSRWWGAALFVTFSAVYFGVGAVLVLRYNLLDPDAPSRVANAGYTFLSRNPHLSAIGFVWNPLPSLVEIPVVWFSQWWAPLKTHGLAGAVQSSLFMAGAVLALRGIALDRGVPTVWRLLAVGGLALHPAIIVYGASGMSEAAEMCCVLWCVRFLLRWVHGARVGDLAAAAIALGVGYLARYEMVPAACGAALLVGLVAYRRAEASQRVSATVLSVLILMFPIVVAVAAWALTGWIVSDELFAQLSSRYGNGSQISAALEKGGPGSRAASSDWVVIAARLFAMQPLVVLAAAAAAGISMLHRRFDVLVPIAAIAPILAFSIYGQVSSTTFGWFRFYLMAVPLVFCIALTCWPMPREKRFTAVDSVTVSPKAIRIGGALIAASLVIATPVTATSMLDERIGNQQLQFGFNSLLRPQEHTASELWYRRMLVSERSLAQYLDRKQLPGGAVLMDTFNTWGVWLASGRPKQFVITSDYDFTAALNRPWANGIRYIVVSNPAYSNADAVNVRYPTFWADGAGLGTATLSVYGATGDERFRVFEVTEPARDPG